MPDAYGARREIMEDEEIRERAIAMIQGYADIQPDMIEMAVQLVAEIPTSRVGMPYCPACESVLCGVCGKCHELDILYDIDCPLAPYDGDFQIKTRACSAWNLAYAAVGRIQREDEGWYDQQ
jgi:hypothetical protein